MSLVRFEPHGLSPQAKTAAQAEAAGRFAWQERGSAAVRAAREESPTGPLLIFNMAGTGAGKTRMNLRAAVGAAGDGPCRVVTALNLRTLTLQTNDAYLGQVGIPTQELACVIGDRTAEKFHAHARASEIDDDGNEAEPDFDATGDADQLPEWLEHFLSASPRVKAVLSLPCVVSTVDFLGAAGDPTQQGHHALAMLRLMTSDVVLDEIDSYDPSGLLAVLRLVQAAAFWGRNLVVSSATLSYPVARAVYAAYCAGLRLREATSGSEQHLARVILMDDLVEPEVLRVAAEEDFLSRYRAHVDRMLVKLVADPRRRPVLVDVDPENGIEGWHAAIQGSIEQLHEINAFVDPSTRKRVSVGLVRVANITGAIPLARHLAESLPHARVACYHSRHFAVQRQHIERRLDYLLTRKGKDPDARLLRDPEIRALLGRPDMPELRLVVVATPVEEIGRDHDFDYAVIEPSSAQSIVQVCGRVRRHRVGTVSAPNVGILRFNRKAVLQAAGQEGAESPVFSMPGLETRQAPYGTADMSKLLNWDCLDRIDASLRFGDHPLAKLDDQSLERAVGDVLPRVTGTDPARAHLWMSENTYRNWPLREQTVPTEDWALSPETGKYHRWQGEGRVKLWQELSGSCAGDVRRSAHDWLVLELDEMQALADDVGLGWEQAFAFKITGADRNFAVDWSFGIVGVSSR